MSTKTNDTNNRDFAQRAARVNSNGAGLLRKVLEQARLSSGLSLNDLTVLSVQNDAYRQDTPAGHDVGRWFGEQIARFVPNRSIHLRGLHYQIGSAADVLKVNGKPYINNHEDWTWLQNDASKAARWLGYVGWDRIVDQRNEPPLIFIPEDATSISWKSGDGAYINLPVSAEAALPRPSAIFHARQPYRIILFGEKASLKEILEPIAKEVGGELLLPTGESSETMIAMMASRIAGDGRPAVIFYFSDFDPAGYQMPISIARKPQAHRDLAYPELEVEIYPVAMTIEQIRQYGLPDTPLKDTERRADRWRQKWGVEQTEIDAMIALHPAELRRIARDAVRPFYDRTLEDRAQEAQTAWIEEADARMRAAPAYQDALARLDAAITILRETPTREASDEFEELQAQIARDLVSAIELPEIVLPDPEIDTSRVPRPLFTTSDDFVTATRRLIDHKKLNGEHD